MKDVMHVKPFFKQKGDVDLKSMRSLYKKLFQYVPDKKNWAYSSMALSAAAVCSYMGAY